MAITYITRATIDAEAPGAYEVIAPQFRDRLAADVFASPQNTEIFRSSFGVFPRLVDDLFARLRYVDGDKWPLWKLVSAFSLVQARIGQNSVLQAGERIYSTMPWPPQVRAISDALRFTEPAYFESHYRAPRESAGGWRVEVEQPTKIILVDDTPYPCAVNEGVVAGICRSFSRQRPSYRILDADRSKRAGGLTTRYEVVFSTP
jgi:hypothetical protein